MDRFDVVVVGSGPAGATAARELAARSVRVLLVERGPFDRDKPCGGGVVAGAAREIPFSIEPVVERRVRGFRLRLPRGRTLRHTSETGLAQMTRRSRLDPFLVARASERGARVDDHRRVRAVERDGTGFLVRFGRGDSARASAVVGADGAGGVVRGSLGLAALPRLVALEADAARVPERYAEHVGIGLGVARGGFSWVFPKLDRCNLGVGGAASEARSLRGSLEELFRREGLDPAAGSVRGHPIPVRDRSPLGRGPALLVGDAAGLADPLSGEGIGAALRSGRIAAEEIHRFLSGAAPDLRGYAARIESEIGRHLRVAARLHALLHRFPGAWFAVLGRSRLAHRLICALLEGSVGYADLCARLGPLGRWLARAPRGAPEEGSLG